jgi:hypothetical protein
LLINAFHCRQHMVLSSPSSKLKVWGKCSSMLPSVWTSVLLQKQSSKWWWFFSFLALWNFVDVGSRSSVLVGSCLYLLNGIWGTWCSWIFLWLCKVPLHGVNKSHGFGWSEGNCALFNYNIYIYIEYNATMLPCLLLCYYVCFILYIIIL